MLPARNPQHPAREEVSAQEGMFLDEYSDTKKPACRSYYKSYKALEMCSFVADCKGTLSRIQKG